jgi:transcriptional regulator with XRE-family HTH domain
VEKMRIHDIFAANLRNICTKFNSISEVARRVGINRQQFNRYLSGENIPNKNTVGRLAKFLGIEESELFRLRDDGPVLSGANFDRSDLARTTELALAGGSQNLLSPGYYCCYFPLQGASQFLVKSLLKVVRRGPNCYFTRRTVFKSGTSPKVTLAEGKHRGIVLASESDIYLLAFDGVDHVHLSIIVIERQQIVGSSVLTGLAITRGTATHFASRICMQPVGTSMKTAKSHLGNLGIVSINNLDLDPTIILMMTAEQAAEVKPSQLGLPQFEDLMISPKARNQVQLKAIV